MQFRSELVTAKYFFRTEYDTAHLQDGVTFKSVEMLKKIIAANADRRGNKAQFFHNGGIDFYAYSFKERGVLLTTLNEVKEGGCLSGSEIFYYGVVLNDGTITILSDAEPSKGREAMLRKFRHLSMNLKLDEGSVLFTYKY